MSAYKPVPQNSATGPRHQYGRGPPAYTPGRRRIGYYNGSGGCAKWGGKKVLVRNRSQFSSRRKRSGKMINTLEELKSELARGRLVEHQFPNVQLKESWKQDNGKQLCGRANDMKSPRAWMVVGVADDGSLAGKSEDWVKHQEEQASEHLNRYLDPASTCSVLQAGQVNGSWVLIVGVSNPGTVVRWNQEAYKSIGTTCQKMAPEEALAFTLQLPGLKDPSAQPWTGTVNPASVQDFARRIALRDKHGLLSNIHLLPHDEILDRLHLKGTVVSRILFGDIRCRIVQYDIADNVLLNTDVPLYETLSAEFQDSLSLTATRKSECKQLWPRLALSEGIANAVAHASYFERGGDIAIELHPKWLCVSNLCTPEAAAFANKWFSRSHQTLNTLLMEGLRLAGIVDELGRGKSLILSEFLTAGLSPPSVTIEPAGRVSRWRLKLPTESTSERYRQVLDRLKQSYPDDTKKALLAMALCLWTDKPLSQIRRYISDEYLPLLTEILEDVRGPVLSLVNEDRLARVRWTRLILDEGLDSKQFSPGEERRLLEFARDTQTEYNEAFITPAGLRKLGGMSESASEKSLSSKMLKRWEQAGFVKKVANGKYRFVSDSTTAISSAVGART